MQATRLSMSAREQLPAATTRVEPSGVGTGAAPGAGHRDSDASDVSTSHLMVYEDEQARKSSISFDKIRQISLTYSLQSEEEVDDDDDDNNGKDDDQTATAVAATPTRMQAGPGLEEITIPVAVYAPQPRPQAQLSNGCSNQVELARTAPAPEVHLGPEVAGVHLQGRECPISGSPLFSNGTMTMTTTTLDRSAPEVVDPQQQQQQRRQEQRLLRNPFMRDEDDPPSCSRAVPSPASPNSLWSMGGEQQTPTRRVRSPVTCWPTSTGNVKATAEPIHHAPGNISLKLPRNMSASIIINNDEEDDENDGRDDNNDDEEGDSSGRETQQQLDYEQASSENSACSSCWDHGTRPQARSMSAQSRRQWRCESDYETARRDNNAALNNQGSPKGPRRTRAKQHEQYPPAQRLVSSGGGGGGNGDRRHQHGPRQRDPNAASPMRQQTRQAAPTQNGSAAPPILGTMYGAAGQVGSGIALERPYDVHRPMLTSGHSPPLNNNPNVCAKTFDGAHRLQRHGQQQQFVQHQYARTGNAQYASTRYVDQHRRLRHYQGGRHRMMMQDDLGGGAPRSQLGFEAQGGRRRVFDHDRDHDDDDEGDERHQLSRVNVFRYQQAGGWWPRPRAGAGVVGPTVALSGSDTEEASEQISIVIGTPTRRLRVRRAQARVDSPPHARYGLSSSAHATPTRSRRAGGGGAHHDNWRHRHLDYDYEDHYYDQLGRAHRGGGGGNKREHDWLAGRNFMPLAGPLDTRDHSSPSPHWQPPKQQQQQQQQQQSDNFLVASPSLAEAAATGPQPAPPQRRLSRRSTVSGSSQEDYDEEEQEEEGDDEQELPIAILHNGRQFQRRPTGPFDAHALAGPAGCGAHQQQAAASVAGDQRAAPSKGSSPATGGAAKTASLSSAQLAPSSQGPELVEVGPKAKTSELGANVAQSPAGPAVATAPPPKNPQPIQKPPPPVKLRNLLTGEQTVDTMHFKSLKNNTGSHGCNELRCQGAMLNPKPVESRVRSAQETWDQAREFINGYYASIKRLETPAHKNRLKEVEEQIKNTETYYLRETELIYGAKLAWRNAPRCIGRIQWSKLQVFDARVTRTAQEMFEAICNHIKYATNRGSLRSAITIFPQRVKSCANDWRVWNPQLISYAGYRDPASGKCLAGDPVNCDITEVCQKLGWTGPGGNFDILPIVLSANGGPPQMFILPEELVMRVKIRHPSLEWFAELNLEWYALPAVSSMMLDVGGLQFTACPFNGWYMVTEVGARDLGDANRYNMLERIAQRMGVNTKTNTSLWRDQAVTQLNLAVLYSYQQAGVTMVDHHTASETFMTHLANEQRLRGGCPADWVWLVPPSASSTTQVFHQEMVLYHLLPNYEYLQPAYKNYDWTKWEQMKAKQVASRAGGLAAAAAAGGSPGGSAAMATVSGSPKSLATSVIGASTSSLSPFSKQRIGINAQQVAAVSANGSPSSSSSMGANELTPRHLRFKEIARAVKFTSKLFGKALSRRIKATILYATETGKSERFANKLAQIFSHAFNVHLMSMADYDMTCLEHEALLIIVTSTFGNGDPPENGEQFVKHLAAIKMTGDTTPDLDSIESIASNPFFQMLSENLRDGLPANGTLSPQELESVSTDSGNANSLSTGSSSLTNGTGSPPPPHAAATSAAALNGERYTSSMLMLRDVSQEQQHQGAPLSNVRFAVFALGSTAYPHFCAFGRYVDDTMGKLGAERIYRCACGDELNGQEKAFDEWAPQVFRAACDVFCVTDVPRAHDKRLETIWTPKDVRFEYQDQPVAGGPGGAPADRLSLASKRAIMANLSSITGKSVVALSVKRRRNLHDHSPDENLQTIQVDLESGLGQGLKFQPGDHISIYPVNKPEVVERLLERAQCDLRNAHAKDDQHKQQQQQRPQLDVDRKVSILMRRDNTDPLTMTQDDEWVQCDTLPLTSVREALTRYLDITNPPSQDFLSILARQTSDQEDQKRLQQMASNFSVYEEWKNKNAPSLLSTLEEFKTVHFDLALITQIPPMKPRFYSISGSSTTSLTVSVVRFKTQATGEPREGLCSNYLNTVPVDPKSYVFGYVRSASAFHMVQDRKTPMLIICAGTGIAPFRAFWQQRHAELTKAPADAKDKNFGPIDLYFGCRNAKYILYRDELDSMLESGALTSVNIAFSRPSEPGKHKMYVQDKLLEHKEPLVDSILHKGVNIYVCGDVAMADGVYKALAKMINDYYKRSSAEGIEYGEGVLMNMRNNNRYHEDIFGSYYKQVA